MTAKRYDFAIELSAVNAISSRAGYCAGQAHACVDSRCAYGQVQVQRASAIEIEGGTDGTLKLLCSVELHVLCMQVWSSDAVDAEHKPPSSLKMGQQTWHTGTKMRTELKVSRV